MSTALRIYNRPGIWNRVAETHKQIRDGYGKIFDHIGIQRNKASLLDSLVFPSCEINLDNMDFDLFNQIKSLLLEDRDLDVDDFRNLKSQDKSYSYSLIHTNVMFSIHKFVRILKIAGYEESMQNPAIKHQKIQQMGLLTTTASMALGIKDFWLFRDIEGAKFYGNAASTTPVRKFLKAMFGVSGSLQTEVNRITFDAATEINKDPMYINTAQWVIGHYMM